MKRLILFMLLVAIVVAPIQAQTIKKSNIKVLYVAPNPNTSDGYNFGGNRQTWKEVKKERAKVFNEFFKKYFKNVTMVYGEDYKEAMSNKHDVTIFDALPPRLDGTKSDFLQLHPKGPDFLSDDYDAATVFIAGPGGALTWNKKINIDWLCNCLDSHAFNIKEEHPIFNTPYKVDMTKEGRKHNPGVFSYYSGKDLPTGEVPMLRMQNVDHLEGYPPGIVANPGFDNDGDAETISGGPCIKSVKAVALGRHGNYFQWGYRADPRHLTESGKLALINSIHYMVQFKGKKPLVKRQSSHRLVALDEIYKASDKGYDGEMKFYQRLHGDYNKAMIRKLAGKSRPHDKYTLGQKKEFPDRAAHLKNVPKEILEKYVDDWNAYLKYYEDNLGYLGLSELKDRAYGGKGYDIIIDKDVQGLGIANNDIKLLEKCVSMLENNEQPALAKRVLERYTLEKFTTAKQWRKWLKKNKNKLFFAERGGYKWMVNIYNLN